VRTNRPRQCLTSCVRGSRFGLGAGPSIRSRSPTPRPARPSGR